MDKLLIAVGSEELAESLSEEAKSTREICICKDGDSALKMLESFCPDQLIIDLHLTYTGGLTVLNSASRIPKAAIALTYSDTFYAIQAAQDVGVGFVMRLPCRAAAIIRNLDELIRIAALPDHKPDPQQTVCRHLRILEIAANREGFRHLQVGIALYQQDSQQSVTKELYPAIAKICGNDNGAQVETAIRNVIGEAWERRDRAVWDYYFPGKEKCPTNKQFISRLAQML